MYASQCGRFKDRGCCILNGFDGTFFCSCTLTIEVTEQHHGPNADFIRNANKIVVEKELCTGRCVMEVEVLYTGVSLPEK